MTAPEVEQHQLESSDEGASSAEHEESPERLPASAWGTLIVFAAFVVLFGTCAANWMFG